MKGKVGFLGLGNMGFPMASNLLKSGFSVLGTDLNKDAENQLKEIGGEIGFDATTLPNATNIIFTSLPTPQIVENVYLSHDGLIANGHKDLILVDLSTISPDLNRKIATAASSKGMDYLGAPVSGSVSGAEAATLSIMVGGEKQTYDKALPYLKAIGKNIFHVGEDHGLGTIVKLINNLLVGIHTQAVAEALTIADAANLDHDVVYDIVNVSSGQSSMFTRNYKNFIADNEYYEGAFTTALLLKDMNLANHAAHSMDRQLPLGEFAIKYFEEHMAGYEDKDIASAYLMLAKQAVTEG